MTAYTGPPPDLAALRQALAETDAAFHVLAARVGRDHWQALVPGAACSAGQTLAHILIIHELVPGLVSKARWGQGVINYVPWLVDQINLRWARWAGDRTDAERVAARHQRATAATLAVIDTLEPDDWGRSARSFSRGQYTVERLVRLPIRHFEEHAPAIERLLGGASASDG